MSVLTKVSSRVNGIAAVESKTKSNGSDQKSHQNWDNALMWSSIPSVRQSKYTQHQQHLFRNTCFLSTSVVLNGAGYRAEYLYKKNCFSSIWKASAEDLLFMEAYLIEKAVKP